MTSKTTNPALRAAATGLGIVHLQENTRDIPLLLIDVQTNFVCRRSRLQPDMARFVAELLFTRRAA